MVYSIYYNDGVFYGTMEFKNKSNEEIEKCIQKEIEDNNRNINPDYHISRKNFKLI